MREGTGPFLHECELRSGVCDALVQVAKSWHARRDGNILFVVGSNTGVGMQQAIRLFQLSLLDPWRVVRTDARSIS